MKFEVTPAPLSAFLIVACFALSGCGPRDTTGQASSSDAVADKEAVSPGDKASVTKMSATEFQAQGTVEEITKAPKPGSVPYKDAVIAVHLTSVQSKKGAPKEMIVYLWGMKDNRLTSASAIQKGQALSLTLQPWESVEDQYGGYNRVELSDPNALSLKPYWGELK